MFELKETPPRMVENGEVAAYGAFESPFGEINMREARVYVSGSKMPLAYSTFRLKEWQHFGFVGDDFYFGFAIVDAKYLGNSFCYLLDRGTGRAVEHDRLAPPGIARLGRELWHDNCRFDFMGYDIMIENRLDEGLHRARVHIEENSKGPGISADLEVIEDLEVTQPLVLVTPLKGGRPAHTHKVACPARGTIECGGRIYSFGEDKGIALIDVQKTLFPYKSFWRWATCGGHDLDGRMIALNLGRGMTVEEERYSDNVLWVDGRMSPLGLSAFDFDETDVLKPWHIETTNGSCVLDFTPGGERLGKINAGLVMSEFHQPYGTFRGIAVDENGDVHEIKDFFGVCEHHLVRW